MTEYVAWLIEAKGPNYLACKYEDDTYQIYWTTKHDEAQHFITEEFANSVITSLKLVTPNFFTITNTEEAIPADHMWLDMPPVKQ